MSVDFHAYNVFPIDLVVFSNYLYQREYKSMVARLKDKVIYVSWLFGNVDSFKPNV